jgi:hypothetical protein
LAKPRNLFRIRHSRLGALKMAVQQNKKSPSRRGMRRAHDFLTGPALTVEKLICVTTSALTVFTVAKK